MSSRLGRRPPSAAGAATAGAAAAAAPHWPRRSTVHLDLDQALRVFRAATAAARAATAEGAGVPEYPTTLAAALTRRRPGDDDGGEGRMSMIAGFFVVSTHRGHSRGAPHATRAGGVGDHRGLLSVTERGRHRRIGTGAAPADTRARGATLPQQKGRGAADRARRPRGRRRRVAASAAARVPSSASIQ